MASSNLLKWNALLFTEGPDNSECCVAVNLTCERRRTREDVINGFSSCHFYEAALRNSSRNGAPVFFNFASSLRVQSQSQHAQGSSPFKSRH